MNLSVKGGNILLSQPPARDVPFALLIQYPEEKRFAEATETIDVKMGQVKYRLPAGLTRKDKFRVYLRML